MHYVKIVTNNNNNLKKIWLGIKEINNIKSKNYDIPNIRGEVPVLGHFLHQCVFYRPDHHHSNQIITIAMGAT